jgi:SAM-dependent MidA family methyltransferase
MAPDFAAALSIHLIETSPALRAAQAGRVPGAAWHDRVEDLPEGPLILLANEFLDALPIRQFVRRADGWRERFVAEGRFVELPADDPGHTGGEGEVVEIGEAAAAVVAGLAGRLAGQGGVALFIDYGPAASAPGESLQALSGGRAADPLEAPGSADLTAHVDFQALAAAARDAGAAVQGPLPQGVFLTRLGLIERSRKLAERQEPARAGAVMQAAQRLVAPELMGRLFKALAVCHPGLPTLPGFEA